jgi:hypothetical protein
MTPERPAKARLLRDLLKDRFVVSKITESGSTAGKLELDRTMLVLWGHAQGVASAISSAGSPIYTAVGQGGFGYSPITGDALTPADIAWAIDEAKRQVEADAAKLQDFKLDLLAFDSCYMSTAEAA